MLPIVRNIQLWHRDPLVSFNRLVDDICKSDPSSSAAVGNVDIYEDDQTLHIDVELPGFEQKQISATLEDGQLHLQAQRDQDKETKEDHYYLRERSSGKWQRSIKLPIEVEPDNVQATYKDGLLKVTLNKLARQQSRKISIN